jgi:peptidase M23-like protein/palmitoyl protein thioesterase
MKRVVAIAMGALSLASPAPAAPSTPSAPVADLARPWLIPPLDAPIVARFDAPEGPYGGGHRGIDYDAPDGSPVRAAADGRILFAGFVPGGHAVTIEHGGGMETTYSLLADTDVAEGDFVTQGHWVGTVRLAHGGRDGGLHFGVKVEGAYVDPEDYLGPLDVSDAIHLVTLDDEEVNPLPPQAVDLLRDRLYELQERGVDIGCRLAAPLNGLPSPPNDNAVVVLAGISSKTAGDASSAVFAIPRRLGYAPQAIYRYSYRGVDGPRHHQPYGREDTYEGIATSAGKLTALMLRIAEDHPEAGVDIVAHSQGGLVARAYLQRAARAWRAGLPRVEHLVTFATPHEGTEAAALGRRLSDASLGGHLVAEGAGLLSERGVPIPAPDAPALRDMERGSNLVRSLASQDVLFGTRVMSLVMARDPLVPAHRALYDGSRGAVVGGDSWFRGHSEVLGSEVALALAHHFLRDGGPTCDEATASGEPPLTARAIEAFQRFGPSIFRLLEHGPIGLRIPGM